MQQAASQGAVTKPVSTVFGISIDALTMSQAVRRCAQAVERRETLIVGVVNVAKLVRMQDDPLLRAAVTSAGLLIADGMGVVWASRLLHRPLPERVPGIDLFAKLLELANERSLSIYLLGARQDVLDKVLERISTRYPGARVAGARNGYFDDGEVPGILAAIRASGADLLFIGISSPKKEFFLACWGPGLGVPVCHGVGGSFDVLAGEVRRAPLLWQRLGLEWFYRVLQEPRRMWKRYLVTNVFFLYLLARTLLGCPRALRQSAASATRDVPLAEQLPQLASDAAWIRQISE